MITVIKYLKGGEIYEDNTYVGNGPRDSWRVELGIGRTF
jgi:hypothetical protein